MSRIETPKPIRGTQSMLKEEVERFDHVVDTFNRVRKLYGFGRVEVPVFESTAVFSRSLGETTDVVSKEMYSFEDRGGDSLTLRPEFTAGISRAYLTEGWQQYAPLKVATHGPLFRYERPQKGRFRQFHQLDAEIIGAGEPAADVELLCFADQLLKELKVDDGVTLQLNTLGDSATREAWRQGLIAHFEKNRGNLSSESLARLQTNPLRILDSKDFGDQLIAKEAPDIDAHMSAEAGAFFEAVRKGLQAAGVDYQRNARLVRGLDYYRHTAFEFVTDRLGAQGTVLGGGRYDGLIETLGGAHTPAVGWAAGIERLAMLIERPRVETPMLAVVVEDDDLLTVGMRLCADMRRRGWSVEPIVTGAPKKRFEKARKMGARTIAILDSYTESQDEIANLRLKGSGFSTGDHKFENALDAVLQERYDVTGNSVGAIERGEQITLHPLGRFE